MNSGRSFYGHYGNYMTWEEYKDARGPFPPSLLKVFHGDSALPEYEAYVHHSASTVCTGVVRFYEAMILDGHYTHRVEFSSRGKLIDELERRASEQRFYSEESLFQCAAAMARTLETLHQHNITHGNLTCYSWIISEDGWPKLTGFALGAVNEGQTRDAMERDVRMLGIVLYEMAFLRPYRYSDGTARDLMATDLKVKGNARNYIYLSELLELLLLGDRAGDRFNSSDCLEVIDRLSRKLAKLKPVL